MAWLCYFFQNFILELFAEFSYSFSWNFFLESMTIKKFGGISYGQYRKWKRLEAIALSGCISDSYFHRWKIQSLHSNNMGIG